VNNLLTSALFFHSLHIVVLGLLLSPIVALLSTLVLKEQIDLIILIIILLLFYGTISHLIYFRSSVMSNVIYVTLLITLLLL